MNAPDPNDARALRVWADVLLRAGDLRGELVQLSSLTKPTAAQTRRLEVLRTEHGGALVGPARPYLRSWTFGQGGLVASVVTEARLFVEGFEEIVALHPRLHVTVTALRTPAMIDHFARLPLSRVHYLSLEWTKVTDATLSRLAPALEGVKNLSLAFNEVTAAGLSALAPHAAGLEFLGLGTSIKQRANGDVVGRGWVDCLCATPAFHNLRAVTMYNYHSPPSEADLERLLQLPRIKHIGLGTPYPLDRLDLLKAQEAATIARPAP
ncbi:MAG: hypothetical protein IPJ65_37775 [Archangiaceae bacterium]|nr:hypothetical protein [Archangiaceae bacterium]